MVRSWSCKVSLKLSLRLLIGLIGMLPLAEPLMAAASLKGSPPTLLILGDSLSAGYGLEPGQGWVKLLEREWQQQGAELRVINASVSGETTSGGLSRLPRLLEQYQPRWLVLELGANDGLRGTPLKAISRNLQRLAELGRQQGCEVLLLGMRIPPNYGARYSDGFYQLFAQVADQTGAAYLPFMLDGVAGDPELMQADGLHPNAQAQPLLLANIRPLLKALIAEP